MVACGDPQDLFHDPLETGGELGVAPLRGEGACRDVDASAVVGTLLLRMARGGDALQRDAAGPDDDRGADRGGGAAAVPAGVRGGFRAVAAGIAATGTAATAAVEVVD